MKVLYKIEKRGKLYVCVMDLPERKKGEGVVFYSSSDRKACQHWLDCNNPEGDVDE